MREKLDVNEAAKRLRDLTIERNIVHLKSQIAQTEASELHNRARKLDSEVMYAAGDLSRAATEDVPEIFMTHIGGDNEAAKQMIAKLVILREEYKPPTIKTIVQIPKEFALDKAVGETFAASIGFSVGGRKDLQDSDEYMAKLFAKRYAENAAGIVPMDEETKVRPILTIGCHCPEEKCEHQQPMMLTEERSKSLSKALAMKEQAEDVSPWDSTIE